MNYCKGVILGAISIALLSACQTNTYGTMVCGDINMTNGTQIAVSGSDRLKMPSRRDNITAITNIYEKNREKRKYSYNDIASLKVWHPASPDDTWSLLPVPNFGWCLLYVDNPHIQIFTYSKHGYGIFASGRATNFYTHKFFSKSKVHFLVAKSGMAIKDIGSVAGYGSENWRKSLCEFVSDDKDLCRLIMQARRRKVEIVKLLSNYNINTINQTRN